jgi:hypothetical protein
LARPLSIAAIAASSLSRHGCPSRDIPPIAGIRWRADV